MHNATAITTGSANQRPNTLCIRLWIDVIFRGVENSYRIRKNFAMIKIMKSHQLSVGWKVNMGNCIYTKVVHFSDISTTTVKISTGLLFGSSEYCLQSFIKLRHKLIDIGPDPAKVLHFDPAPPLGAYDVSEVWAILIWTNSPSLVTVSPPQLKIFHFICRWDGNKDKQTDLWSDYWMQSEPFMPGA